jgi:hypothetical protein
MTVLLLGLVCNYVRCFRKNLEIIKTILKINNTKKLLKEIPNIDNLAKNTIKKTADIQEWLFN